MKHPIETFTSRKENIRIQSSRVGFTNNSFKGIIAMESWNDGTSENVRLSSTAAYYFYRGHRSQIIPFFEHFILEDDDKIR